VGIKRTVEWSLRCAPEEADARLRAGLAQLGMKADGALGHIHAKAKRSLMKNRWAADIDVAVAAASQGTSTVTATVDMAGK
jgi:hypothetical protein